jgi:hypothetical protein
MGRALGRGKMRAPAELTAIRPATTLRRMRADAGANPLESAISGMQALKTEHAPILVQIARDPGMSPDTRATLIAHLLEEEDEKLARIAAAAGLAAPLAAGTAHATPAASTSASRLTVGSLRTPFASTPGAAGPTSTPDPAARRTVGSLRAR